MKFFKILVTTAVLTTTSLETSAIAQDSPTPTPVRSSQILKACINNQAETLPIPFSDVSPDHWAFKAVMTMYYCGAFRQATPPALLEKLQPTQGQQILPEQPKSQLEK
ncbi:MAG: S-layer protein [Scytonema sp. PMC 1069.18]|nr:S-layer protein [Scytonema sp. PMC 1069.18]MEC4887315.1 S-layer protein [Scytonema sp. PMC 1070.18]